MTPTVRRVNQRYCKLLSETFEKYKGIDIVPSKTISLSASLVESECDTVKLSRRLRRLYQDSDNVNVKSKSETINHRKHHFNNLTNRKKFSHEEDMIIQKEIENGELSFQKKKWLSVKLCRKPNSIERRVEILRNMQLSGNASEPTLTRFTLQEDMLIIDEAVEDLKKCKMLKNAKLLNAEDLFLKLRRTEASVNGRWVKRLKPWLLQYYNKTLNLEIRPMLTQVIADNFDSVSSIDWEYLAKLPEFSGHTPESLAPLFSSAITIIVYHLGISRTELSLPEIAKLSRNNFENSTVRRVTEKRQQEVIKYFEKLVKQNGIINFI